VWSVAHQGILDQLMGSLPSQLGADDAFPYYIMLRFQIVQAESDKFVLPVVAVA